MEFEFLRMIKKVPDGYVENGLPFDMALGAGRKFLRIAERSNSSYWFKMFAAESLYDL